MKIVAGIKVRLQFQGRLNKFLPIEKRDTAFEHSAGATDTLKHVVESLGAPHTEVGGAIANGMPADLAKPLVDGDAIEILAHQTPTVLHDRPAFVVDGHLGRLAAYLRMLGFDTWYERMAEDPQLASISSREHRILLTRDVGLLKRKEVRDGYFVRSDKPLEQLRELVQRFTLRSHFAPFTRCMECNGHLEPVEKRVVLDLLPPHTRETKNEFSRCVECGRIFWRGSHHARMLGWVQKLSEGRDDG